MVPSPCSRSSGRYATNQCSLLVEHDYTSLPQLLCAKDLTI
uniref:Uncharacterized protein n=1 Tax=Arundo donax TaxID=35708 RepID=A0A0A9FK25_ARUDO